VPDEVDRLLEEKVLSNLKITKTVKAKLTQFPDNILLKE